MKILKWIVALPFIALALFIVARFVMCRPDGEVVRVATPMVEKIADYIVKHGVPDSLADIPDLPYALEGCSRKVVYWNDHKIVTTSKNSTWKEVLLSCYFIKENIKYKIFGRFTAFTKNKENWEGDLDIQYAKTIVGIRLKTQNGNLIREGVSTGFDRRFGFCKQFKM